jgi:hypothetical protein
MTWGIARAFRDLQQQHKGHGPAYDTPFDISPWEKARLQPRECPPAHSSHTPPSPPPLFTRPFLHTHTHTAAETRRGPKIGITVIIPDEGVDAVHDIRKASTGRNKSPGKRRSPLNRRGSGLKNAPQRPWSAQRVRFVEKVSWQ